MTVDQPTLQYLSRRRARQLADEGDVARNREATQTVSDVALDHVFVQRGPPGADDERGEALTELRIRNAYHCHVGDLRQDRDGLLDGPREDVLAAGDDHLVVASGDEQPA